MTETPYVYKDRLKSGSELGITGLENVTITKDASNAQEILNAMKNRISNNQKKSTAEIDALTSEVQKAQIDLVNQTKSDLWDLKAEIQITNGITDEKFTEVKNKATPIFTQLSQKFTNIYKWLVSWENLSKNIITYTVTTSADKESITYYYIDNQGEKFILDEQLVATILNDVNTTYFSILVPEIDKLQLDTKEKLTALLSNVSPTAPASKTDEEKWIGDHLSDWWDKLRKWDFDGAQVAIWAAFAALWGLFSKLFEWWSKSWEGWGWFLWGIWWIFKEIGKKGKQLIAPLASMFGVESNDPDMKAITVGSVTFPNKLTRDDRKKPTTIPQLLAWKIPDGMTQQDMIDTISNIPDNKRALTKLNNKLIELLTAWSNSNNNPEGQKTWLIALIKEQWPTLINKFPFPLPAHLTKEPNDWLIEELVWWLFKTNWVVQPDVLRKIEKKWRLWPNQNNIIYPASLTVKDDWTHESTYLPLLSLMTQLAYGTYTTPSNNPTRSSTAA
jgi:hypothetical protein